jgi:hypothetical protein
MRKSLLLSSVALASALIAGTAFAGEKTSSTSQYVTIGTGFANGQVGAVRNSPDTVQYILCGVTAVTGSPTQVTCMARNTAGTNAMCTSTNAAHITAVSTISANSNIYFVFSGGTCTTVSITTGSPYEIAR